MAVIRIDGGCSRINTPGETLAHWSYIYDDLQGTHIIVFTSALNVVPKLGDNIDTSAGILVPRALIPANDNKLSPTWPTPIINNDPGFQAKKERYKTWPEDFKG